MLLEVSLPVPLPRTFTYRLEREGPPPAPGTRVRVPFGRRTLVGWVLGTGRHEPDARLRDVQQVLDLDGPSVTPELLRLCRWIADYYLAPLGQVLRTALPAVLSDTARDEPPVRTRRVLRLTAELPSLLQREEVFGRAHRQRACFELLEATGRVAEVTHLTRHSGFSYTVLNGLVERGLAEIIEEEVERDPFAGTAEPPAPDLTPTPAQAAAIATLRAAADGPQAAPPAPFLLRGVTGSGKTLVYIELLEEVVVRQGRGAIVLVPEIALTPQTVSRFRARFGDAIAVLHSALSEGERYDAWRALLAGERRIAVGARSAIFAPVRDLGAIVVDEEHEGSYKQSETPRYHARELAVVRARMAGAVCVLGSATPSLESWNNALRGKFRLLELPTRVEGRPLPPVQVVDMRRSRARPEPGPAGGMGTGLAASGRGDGILSPALHAAVRARLERSEQIILLLNRRGYSTFVQCRDCGHVWHCEQCNVSLTYHRRRRRVVCHYCMHEEPAPARCPDCGSADIAFRGVGTEQVERSVIEAFPAARVARMDVDTTSRKWSHHEILSRVGRLEVDILLGTQMIAKGLDFPGVTLVGVINADVGMNLPDFRASERTFQLLTQVAGRAGRGPRGGEVLVQTALPTHYAIRAALEHDYRGFAEQELEERRGPDYPPHCRMLNVVLSGLDQNLVHAAAEETAAWVRDALRGAGEARVRLTGPAPCPIDRIRGRWRWHLLLRSASPGAIGAIGRALAEAFDLRPGPARLRVILDRDPVSLL